MIQSIRILRDKKDDLLLLYLMEFFKFIGCVVTDWMIDYEHGRFINWEEYWEERYDVEIALSAVPDILPKFSEQFINLFDGNGNYIRKNRIELLDYLIMKIWGKTEWCKDIQYINNIYAKEELFYCLYNKGNLGFIHEYYLSNNKDKTEKKDSRRKACEISYVCMLNAYEELSKYAYSHLSVYYEFAMLNLRHKLNGISMMLTEQKMFLTDRILEMAQKVIQKDNSLVRFYYLIAKICSEDVMLIHKAEFYYDRTLELWSDAKYPKRILSFVYYQKGRFAEKVKKDLASAEENYRQAYQYNNQDYKVLYKMIESFGREGNILNVIEKSNILIAKLLNGYELSKIMPKEAVYGYKCFGVLGDVYAEIGSFDLAIKCYEKAIDISEAKNVFYLAWRSMDECFENNYKACIPIRPILFRIINCASQGGNTELIDECYSKM